MTDERKENAESTEPGSGPAQPTEATSRLERISQQDIDEVTQQFTSWITTLPEQEQLIMGWILSRAAAASNEVGAAEAAEAGATTPVSVLMARAAGLRELPSMLPQTIGPVNVWTFRF
jgi:hypothetical protein